MQQRKKNRSRRASAVPGIEDNHGIGAEAAAEEATKDEEYKLMYHQAFKGAAFAFVSPIGPTLRIELTRHEAEAHG
jgi:hypothetical protein